MDINRPVIIYGAGFRGGTNFIICAHENIHVEAFCDRDAENIPLYFGCNVLTCEEAVKRYPTLPYIVSIDNDESRRSVLTQLKELGVEAYESFEDYFQGANDAEVETVFCGNEEGFFIVPTILENKRNLLAYSFGVGNDFSFEMELAQKYNVQVYAFDPSPNVAENIEAQILPNNFKYYPYGLSNEDSMKEFYIPNTGKAGNYSEYFAPWTNSKKTKMQVYRLSTLMKKFGHAKMDLLKMDIEGSEFMALPDILNTDIVFDQLCIEIHTRIFPNSVERMRGLRGLLNKHGYLMVHNGEQEQTYLREDALKTIYYKK